MLARIQNDLIGVGNWGRRNRHNDIDIVMLPWLAIVNDEAVAAISSVELGE